MAVSPLDLRQVERISVQDLPQAKEGAGMSSFFWGATQTRGFHLPPWGTRERERLLRMWYRHEYNWMGQSAIGGLLKEFASAEWEIKGTRNAQRYQDLLRYASFSQNGSGWRDLCMKVGLDYLRQDGGAYIELIAPGDPSKPPTGSITGLAHLDSLRCIPTGDPEYPVIYWSRLGKLHLLHNARVIHLLDQPDGDDERPGYGLCAMSRAISIVIRQIWETRYVEAKLDDKPSPGFLVATNINRGKWAAAFDRFNQEQNNDEQPGWGKTIPLFSDDPAFPADLKQVLLSQAPEAWSFREYTELDANSWALALGVDVQELWQLTGGRLGSAQQSEMLHAKSRGKTLGDLRTTVERALNDVLPDYLVFQYKAHDPYEEASRADNAQLWGGFTEQVKETLTPDEMRQLLANTVEAYRDVVTDPKGLVRRLNDADTQPEARVSDLTTADAPPTGASGSSDPKVTATDTTAIQSKALTQAEFIQAVADLRARHLPRTEYLRALKQVIAEYAPGLTSADLDTLADQLIDDPATDNSAVAAVLAALIAHLLARLTFEAAFNGLLTRGRAGDLSPAALAVRLRAELADSGLAEFQNGLRAGGVSDGVLSETDRAEYLRILAQQSAFVTPFATNVGTLSAAEAATRAQAWYARSVTPFWDAGRLSADRSGNYKFIGSDGYESCSTCQRLKFQVHRMDEWTAHHLRPKTDGENFDCHGDFCEHFLTRTSDPAQGNWLN